MVSVDDGGTTIVNAGWVSEVPDKGFVEPAAGNVPIEPFAAGATGTGVAASVEVEPPMMTV